MILDQKIKVASHQQNNLRLVTKIIPYHKIIILKTLEISRVLGKVLSDLLSVAEIFSDVLNTKLNMTFDLVDYKTTLERKTSAYISDV